MSDQFWIKERRMEAPIAVIAVGGRLGAKPAKVLRELCNKFSKDGYIHLVIDMSDVTFIASSGVGAMIVLTGEFSIKGGGAIFVSLSQPVQRSIKMLNLGRFLAVATDEQEAITSLRATS
jgi:anti-sigma B factor antagonist